MATVEDVLEEITRTMPQDEPLRCWRITGTGRKQVSGCADDALVAARAAIDELDPGTYQLWVTTNPKQVYSGDGWHAVRKFELVSVDEGQIKEERIQHLLADNKALRGQAASQLQQLQELTEVLTKTTAAHAKALATSGEGLAKILEATTGGMSGLAVAQVDLLGQAKDILKATAEDSRDAVLASSKNGFWRSIWEPLAGDVAKQVQEALPMIFNQGLPLALQAGRFFLSLAGPKND